MIRHVIAAIMRRLANPRKPPMKKCPNTDCRALNEPDRTVCRICGTRFR